MLLFGATGSGKTEVYLQAAQRLLDQDPGAQVLVMVPEINLTPQLQQRFEARFGAVQVTAMHSGLTPAQRLGNWLAAHLGQARIVLGTRMAVLASLQRRLRPQPSAAWQLDLQRRTITSPGGASSELSANECAVLAGMARARERIADSAELLMSMAVPLPALVALMPWRRSDAVTMAGRARCTAACSTAGEG